MKDERCPKCNLCIKYQKCKVRDEDESIKCKDFYVTAKHKRIKDKKHNFFTYPSKVGLDNDLRKL